MELRPSHPTHIIVRASIAAPIIRSVDLGHLRVSAITVMIIKRIGGRRRRRIVRHEQARGALRLLRLVHGLCVLELLVELLLLLGGREPLVA